MQTKHFTSRSHTPCMKSFARPRKKTKIVHAHLHTSRSPALVRKSFAHIIRSRSPAPSPKSFGRASVKVGQPNRFGCEKTKSDKKQTICFYNQTADNRQNRLLFSIIEQARARCVCKQLKNSVLSAFIRQTKILNA